MTGEVSIPLDDEHRWATLTIGYSQARDMPTAEMKGHSTGLRYEWWGGCTVNVYGGGRPVDCFNVEEADFLQVWDAVNARERCAGGQHEEPDKDGFCPYCGTEVLVRT